MVSDSPIDYPHVECPDIFVAMSQGAYGEFRSQIAREGRVFYDCGLVKPAGGPILEQGFDVTDTAIREFKSKQVANVIWVGVLAGCTGWFSQTALERAAKESVPERFLDLNLKGLSLGLQLGHNSKRP